MLPGGTNPPPADIVDVPRWLWQVGLGFALIGSVVAGLAMYPSAGLRASGPTRGQDRHAAVVFGATIDAGFVLAWFAVPSSPYRSGTLGAATMTTVFACCTWIKDRGNE